MSDSAKERIKIGMLELRAARQTGRSREKRRPLYPTPPADTSAAASRERSPSDLSANRSLGEAAFALSNDVFLINLMPSD